MRTLASLPKLFNKQDSSSLTYIPKILSGIDVIDTTWGGLYQGGSYICYGHATSGRGLLGMLFLRTGILLEEKGLFIAPGRPQDWFIQASSVQFDLEEARETGLVHTVWIPATVTPQQASDDRGEQVMDDLFRIIERGNVERVVINDFVPFLQFYSFERFCEAFTTFIERLENVSSTVLIMMPDTINTGSRQIVDFMRNHLTGSIHISAGDDGEAPVRLTLVPGVGHVERATFDDWEIPINPPSEPLSDPQSSPGSIRVEESTSADGTAGARLTASSFEDVAVSHEGFVNRLNDLFKRRALKGDTEFLLVALRVEGHHQELDSAVIQERLIPVIEDIVAEPGDLLLDSERRRIIALLPGADADGVQSFFEMIQGKLSEKDPEMAAQLPHVVSAVVVPNGQPFENPQDFLAYALEGR